MRKLQFVLAAVLGLASLGASDAGARSAALSHQMMCVCSCAQILGECNHMGCPDSGPMMTALQTDVAQGMSNRAVLLAFEQQYGPTVLASPMFTRLNQASWYVPGTVLILGLLGALLLLRRWQARTGAPESDRGSPPTLSNASPNSAPPQVLERIRRETGGW